MDPRACVILDVDIDYHSPFELKWFARQTFHFETAKVVFANTTRSAKRVKLSTSDIILEEILQCHYSPHWYSTYRASASMRLVKSSTTELNTV